MRVLAVLLLLFSISLAKLKVVATYPWIGELVKEVGKDWVSLYVIAKGTEDPHFVVPKPSHIAKMRDADLLIVQGASLEVGFLPPFFTTIQQPKNPTRKAGLFGFVGVCGTHRKASEYLKGYGRCPSRGKPSLSA